METKIIDKRTFVIDKLKNFILYVEEIFGKNNVLIKEFGDYVNIERYGPEPFLKGIVQLASIFYLPANTIEKEQMNTAKVSGFLKSKGLFATTEHIKKLLRYLDMFLRII